MIYWIMDEELTFESLNLDALYREVLLRGKAQYSWPPCTN